MQCMRRCCLCEELANVASVVGSPGARMQVGEAWLYQSSFVMHLTVVSVVNDARDITLLDSDAGERSRTG